MAAEPAGANNEMAAVVMQVQKMVAQHAGGGIRGIARIFKNLDHFGKNRLDKNDLKDGLRDYKLKFSNEQIDMLIKAFDRNGGGTVNYDDFLIGVRGEMSAPRIAVAKRAFAIMDKDKSGVIDLDDIRGTYSAKLDPRVIKGELTEDDVLQEFLNVFEGGGGNKDGKITMDEWLDYYKAVSSSVDTDDYFVEMVQRAWKMDEYGKAVAKGERL